MEYGHPFSKQNLFLEQLIILHLSYYNENLLKSFPKKLTHLSSIILQRLLSFAVGIEKTDLVKYFSLLLSLLLLIRQFYGMTYADDIIVLMSLAVFRQRLLKETCPGKYVTSCIGAHGRTG